MVLPSPVKVLPPGPSFGAAEPYKEYSLPPDESPKGSKSLSHAPTGPCALFGGQDAPSHHLSPSGFNRPPQTCYSRPRKRRRKKKRATMEIFKPSLTPGYASPLAWDPEGFVTPHHKRSVSCHTLQMKKRSFLSLRALCLTPSRMRTSHHGSTPCMKEHVDFFLYAVLTGCNDDAPGLYVPSVSL
jgi:hypothetical protein